MDCVEHVEAERTRLEGRRVSATFHLAVIEQALRFIPSRLPDSGTDFPAEQAMEVRAACLEALEALADLKSNDL